MPDVTVNLRGTFGYGRPPKYYGPGLVSVPEGLARALGLTAVEEEGIEEQTEAPPVEGEQIGGFVPVSGATPLPSAELVDLLGPVLSAQLAGAGYDSPDLVRAASDDDILAIDGIGAATLRKIRMAVEE